MRVLLIEDDSATAQSIELMLKSESFNVYTTDLGEEGVDLGKLYDYDIILLDLNLPDMSGFEVLRSLRVSKVKTPILILSGLAGIEDKVRGLGFGADDYMTKPFHKDELVARIHAIVRRSKGHAQSVIQTGDLVVNLDTKTVEVNGARVHLTGKEYQMLELLSLRKGTTLTKEMFLNHLYGGMDEPELKIIDVFICKLRKKLANASNGKNYIETVWGRGYVLREPAETTRQDPGVSAESRRSEFRKTPPRGGVFVCALHGIKTRRQDIVTIRRRDVLVELVDDLAFGVDAGIAARALKIRDAGRQRRRLHHVAIRLHRAFTADQCAFAAVGVGIDVMADTLVGARHEPACRHGPQPFELAGRARGPHREAGVRELHLDTELRQRRRCRDDQHGKPDGAEYRNRIARLLFVAVRDQAARIGWHQNPFGASCIKRQVWPSGSVKNAIQRSWSSILAMRCGLDVKPKRFS